VRCHHPLHTHVQEFKIKGTWTDKTTAYGYDFWYQPRFDVVISSEFGSPNAFKQGFDPSLVVRIGCNRSGGPVCRALQCCIKTKGVMAQ
jgi:56kDa selenium binding protein (SBP56)